jgi:hypothetical protein
LNNVAAPTSTLDGCPILTREQAFEFSSGVAAVLNFTVRNDDGTPIDLTSCMPNVDFGISSSSILLDADDGAPVRVRFGEVTGESLCGAPFIEVAGTVLSSAQGQIQVAVPPQVYNRSGVYVTDWGLFNGPAQMFGKRAYICISRSLFDADAMSNPGPPTLSEIRMAMRDSSFVENNLLQRVEFDNAELGMAISRPIIEWNDIPPPVPPRYSTHTFPFKEAWLWGIQGYLLQTAAHTYRRNQLAYQAAGVAIDDMNKEQQYIQAAEQMLSQWRDFTITKKVSVNAQRAMGIAGSEYRWAGLYNGAGGLGWGW